ncbi:Copper metallochaperone PCu(A)C, inserts Cu(I) into cytochrome oxidase subunit II [Pseudomonas synxantha]|uniref:Copper metallochaperone PCu(A)C, inserts Cu(I) into cytochrome oxidase subunit II n=1 Tax=Pseudomonas synxantha TaxID=47883 RepID=A0A3G7U0U8_9PSED|nr:copper chaperone PCu(A)C [Pseudomonas synxantha]AZE52771.1 Copper metallochaperone PCu(A)C, inserts Cu(I) into cytochrome oxidase subunit II [Pseudomonas synxantha]
MLKSSLLLAALLLPVFSAANADDYKVGDLMVSEPWSQELPPNAPTVAAYFVIHNTGKTADRLLSVDTPVADKAELHEHVMQGDLMKMQPVPSVAVPAEGELTFAPMAYHVMLLGLKDRSLLADGKQFPLTLTFEKAGRIEVEVSVQKVPPRATREHKHTH